MHPKYQKHKDKEYLEFIRTKPCVVCGAKSIAHHVYHAGGKHGNDFLSIPLCNDHHTLGGDSYHNLGHDSFIARHNLCLEFEIINLLIEYIEEIKN